MSAHHIYTVTTCNVMAGLDPATRSRDAHAAGCAGFPRRAMAKVTQGCQMTQASAAQLQDSVTLSRFITPVLGALVSKRTFCQFHRVAGSSPAMTTIEAWNATS